MAYHALYSLYREMIYNALFYLFVSMCVRCFSVDLSMLLTSWTPAAVPCFARYVKNAEKTQERLQHAIELMNLGGDSRIRDRMIPSFRVYFFVGYFDGNIYILCMYRYI